MLFNKMLYYFGLQNPIVKSVNYFITVMSIKIILCYYDIKVKMIIFFGNGILVIIYKCCYNAHMKYVAL
jgi:hypothetical protein